MSFNYHKMDYRGVDDAKASTPPKLSPAGDDVGRDGDTPHQQPSPTTTTTTTRSFYARSNDAEEPEMKAPHHHHHDGPVKSPADVKNGDLVSLLLAATPPYLYNIPLIPQTFFFSEMLKSFVQAKTERQNLKAQQTHYKRGKKRSWRESSPPKTSYYEMDKPLELTTPKHGDRDKLCPKRFPAKATEKKSDFGSSNFTAEKLANSSVTGSSSSSSGSSGGGGADTSAPQQQHHDLLPPTPPLWYPPLYPPPHPSFGIDPLHFFIDLRVSAHVWDRKLTGDGERWEPRPGSAFGAPELRRTGGETASAPRRRRKSQRSVHYLMSNLRRIYGRGAGGEGPAPAPEDKTGAGEEEDDEDDDGRKKCKDLRALIGLELVVDYVKQESDEEENDVEEERGKGHGVDVDRVADGTCH